MSIASPMPARYPAEPMPSPRTGIEPSPEELDPDDDVHEELAKPIARQQQTTVKFFKTERPHAVTSERETKRTGRDRQIFMIGVGNKEGVGMLP